VNNIFQATNTHTDQHAYRTKNEYLRTGGAGPIWPYSEAGSRPLLAAFLFITAVLNTCACIVTVRQPEIKLYLNLIDLIWLWKSISPSEFVQCNHGESKDRGTSPKTPNHIRLRRVLTRLTNLRLSRSRVYAMTLKSRFFHSGCGALWRHCGVTTSRPTANEPSVIYRVVQKSEATTFEGSDLCMPTSLKCPNKFQWFLAYFNAVIFW